MGTEQTTVGEQATQEQIFIKLFNLLKDNMNVFEGLMHGLLQLDLLDELKRIRQVVWFENSSNDATEPCSFMVEERWVLRACIQEF